MDINGGVRAREAQGKLTTLFWDDPDVRVIELSCEPPTGRTVLRVHVRNPAARSRLALPEDVNGVPVRVVVGDYGPEG